MKLLTNEQVIRIWKTQNKIKKRVSENIAKYKRLGKSIESDQAKLMIVESSGEIGLYHGQLLSVNEYEGEAHGSKQHGANISALAQDNRRAARIYLNQHNYETYGAHIYDYSLSLVDRNRERWLGADWKEFDTLLNICIKYVALGKTDKIKF